jgi:hypothetical protein
MKKLIIVLSALAIANFNFIPAVKAGYKESEIPSLIEQVTTLKERGLSVSQVATSKEFLLLGDKMCKHGELDAAVNEMKELRPDFYALIITGWYFDKAMLLKHLTYLKTVTDEYCPDKRVFYPKEILEQF